MRVLRSDDDVLFLVGGNNEVARLYSASGFAALVSLDAWRERVLARDALFRRLNIRWRLLLVPEKLAVLGEDVLARQCPGAVPPGARLAAALAHSGIVDPLPYLRAQRDRGYLLYPRTDSHWTTLGAFSAFQWLLATLGITVDFQPFADAAPIAMTYRGDLWGDGYPDLPPDLFERRAVPRAVQRIHANDIVALKEVRGLENEAGLHVGSHVAYRNDTAERQERLVLFGSSYSDHRLECALLTYVAALFFREVHFVWSTSLDIALIERIAPDMAIIEMPERFIGACPRDDFDLAAHEADIVAAWHRSATT